MELTSEFDVAMPADEAWPLLTDIERVAPCVPGFQLKDSAGDEFQGTMKVKVGAVQITYDCVIRFVELNDDQRRAVISATGKETRGQGGVTASITSAVMPKGESSHVEMVTDLNVTGRVAQFGRGILAEVSDRLVKQFVRRLEASVAGRNGVPAETAGQVPAGTAEQGSTRIDGSRQEARADFQAARPGPGGGDDEALDLMSVAGGPLVKRLILLLAIALILAAVFAWLRARSFH